MIQVLKDAKIKGLNQDIFSRRSIPTAIDTLPVALVYPNTLNVDDFDESPKRYMKSLDITIEVITTDDNDEQAADCLDDLSLDVEAAIENSIELEQCVERVSLKNVIYGDDGDGANPVHSSRVTFTIDYITEPRVDAFVLPDLKSIHTTYNVNGNEDGEAKDITNFEGV